MEAAMAVAPEAGAMPIAVGDSGRMEVARCLVQCAAFAKEMETQSHLIHLNYEGDNFLPVHEFLKGQYEAHLEQFDALAEFVRAMDFLMPLCACGLKDAVSGFENVTEADSRMMLMTYCRNLTQVACMAGALERAAAASGQADVQNYAAELMGFSNKSAWFVKSTLRGC